MAYWDKITSRGDVDDRRGMAPVASGISVAGVLAVLIYNYLAGGDLVSTLEDINRNALQGQLQTADTTQYEGMDAYEQFASAVLGSNNDVWKQEFEKMNKPYTPPKLVLFRQATQSACGGATSAVGPHYCPLDQTIYLDETFFDILTERLGAKGGDVAQAYVIAHEVGHHAQNALGDIEKSQESNEMSIKTELQADCYAGIWAHSLKDKGIFEKNEIAEAMDAAAAVGDDRIQEKTQGRSNPETWTHGSSEDRTRWFTTGYENGSVERCNTFQK